MDCCYVNGMKEILHIRKGTTESIINPDCNDDDDDDDE